MAYIFTIIFMSKLVSNLRKNFCCITGYQKPTVLLLFLILQIIYNLVTFPYFWVDQDEFKPVSIWVWVIKCLGIIVLIGIWMVIYTIHKKNLCKEAENIEKKTPGV